jgi:eukaryotic-like serine/threonine-protein kinase
MQRNDGANSPARPIRFTRWTYFRGEVFGAGQGKAAADEFQTVINHSGIVWNCWTGVMAKLGVARANASQAKTQQGADAARIHALAAYKGSFAFWKDADPDVPILKQAMSEYAKLQQRTPLSRATL